MKGHVIIVLLLAKVKYFNGQDFVSNSFYGSKLFIDSGMDEVTNFRNSLIESKGDDTSTHKIKLISSRPYPLRDEFLTITTKRNIDDLREMMELSKTCSSIVIGTIKCVQQDVPWYYLGCSKCPRKVKTVVLDEENDSGQVRETFQCTKCKDPVIDVVPRFMFPLRIQDTTGSASLTLFDFDASKILNKTASEIVEGLHEPAETESLNPAFGDYSNQGSLSIQDAVSCTRKNNSPPTVEKSTASSPDLKPKIEKSTATITTLKRKFEDVYCDDVPADESKNNLNCRMVDEKAIKEEAIISACKMEMLVPKKEP